MGARTCWLDWSFPHTLQTLTNYGVRGRHLACTLANESMLHRTRLKASMHCHVASLCAAKLLRATLALSHRGLCCHLQILGWCNSPSTASANSCTFIHQVQGKRSHHQFPERKWKTWDGCHGCVDVCCILWLSQQAMGVLPSFLTVHGLNKAGSWPTRIICGQQGTTE